MKDIVLNNADTDKTHQTNSVSFYFMFCIYSFFKLHISLLLVNESLYGFVFKSDMKTKFDLAGSDHIFHQSVAGITQFLLSSSQEKSPCQTNRHYFSGPALCLSLALLALMIGH